MAAITCCQEQNVSWRHVLYGVVPILCLLVFIVYESVGGAGVPFFTPTALPIQSESPVASDNMSTTPLTVEVTTQFNGSTTPSYWETPAQVRRDFWIGLCLAVFSSIFIGTSFILKKLGLLSVAKKSGHRAGDGGYQYLKEWLWWCGMTLMIGGEMMNFTAFAFAPATLVVPLGALSVITSALLASYFLDEGLNLVGKLGCLLCILGSTMMVIHSPKEAEIKDLDQLLNMVKEPAIIVVCSLMLVVAVGTIIFIAPKWGHTNVVVYVLICASLGSFTVTGCKGLGVALKETFGGRNEFTNWFTYVLLAVVVVCILLQLKFLNQALDIFNTAIVTPTYYVLFTSCVMLISIVLFKEFLRMSVEDIVGDICGFLTIVTGIFLLNAFKDLDISIKNLPKATKKGTNDSKKDEHVMGRLISHDHHHLLECNENSSGDEMTLLDVYDDAHYSSKAAKDVEKAALSKQNGISVSTKM